MISPSEFKSPQLQSFNKLFKIHSSIQSVDHYKPDKKKIDKLHKLGFTSAHIVPDTGIFRGQTSLIQLNNSSTIIEPSVAQTIKLLLLRNREKCVISVVLTIIERAINYTFNNI